MASRSSSVVEGDGMKFGINARRVSSVVERAQVCAAMRIKNLADFSSPFVIYEIPREKSDKIRCGP